MLQGFSNKSLTMKIKTVPVLLLALLFLQAGTGSVSARDKKSETGRIRIAGCQFPISADIQMNFHFIEQQIIEASLKKADVVQFPECALSGYPGTDMKSMDAFKWDELHRMTDSVRVLAKKYNVWVILGSLHRLSGTNKPHNSLYVINPDGDITDRYDKRFCTGSDLEYCSPGDHFVIFRINGVNCGLLICYDIRFPELYREYRKLGCNVIFQSFYNARSEKVSIHPVIMPISAQAHAATNYFFMSLTNSSAPESWPCHFITPDGLIQNKLSTNVPGVLISELDTNEKFYDASGEYREDAMKGKLNSGKTVTDPKSEDRRSY
jgi:deaminated glutathione amidase